MGHRRRSREYALQGLYMYELSRPPIVEVLSLGWVDRDIPPDIRDFAEDLIRGAVDNIEKIDELIVRHSKNWKFERLSVVDKSILRLSIYALLYHPEIPAPVTINEAIELGKIYGGEGSGQFINGILDAVRKSEIKEHEQC
ncbi:MAG: transcription antitermination factor NusB [Spirochaetes bacterium]|jgi:N utilization substance protein B|nr:transcription antitermination factor NusB [Spirochaetota bacterium]